MLRFLPQRYGMHREQATLLVLLTFDRLHSSMLLAYDNLVWCALEVHNGDRHGSFSNLFVILEEISLWLQPWPQIGYGVCSTPVS